MILDEDRGPRWLRGYGDIEADIRQMREFAAKLEAEVRQNYAPHLAYIADDMSTRLPDPCDAFVELVHFLQAHQETQQASTNLVYALASATGGLATAADLISQRYAEADAFAAARAEDVQRALHGAQVTGATSPAAEVDPPVAPVTDGVLP